MNNESPERSLTKINRLHTLIRFASSPVRSNHASRVVNETVTTLAVKGCVFHWLREGARAEAIALQGQTGVDAELLSQLASRLYTYVESGRQPFLNNDLSQLITDDPLVNAGIIKNYLGVPMFNSKGNIFGVASLFSGASRKLDESDLSWMETAVHLASAAMACEGLDEELSELERVLEQESANDSRQTNISNSSDMAPSKSGKLSVLVVDDDRAVNHMLRRFLERHDYEVDTALNGLEALRMFQVSSYDVVITDLVMPGLNGWELIGSLRSIAPKLPIIVITGYSNNNNGIWNQQFLQNQGIIAVLNKPIDFNYLTSLLEELNLKK